MDIQKQIEEEYLKFCETNPHDSKYPISTIDFEHLLSIISQQAIDLHASQIVIDSLKDEVDIQAAEIERYRKFLQEFSKRTPYEMYQVQIAAVLDGQNPFSEGEC